MSISRYVYAKFLMYSCLNIPTQSWIVGPIPLSAIYLFFA